MFFEYPAQDNYTFTITTQYGDIVLQYTQATAQETIEYLEMFDDDNYMRKAQKVQKYWIDFITKHTKKIKKRRYTRKSKVITEAKKKLEQYVDTMAQSYHKQRKSLYFDKPKAHNKEAKPNYFDNTPFLISKYTGVHVNDINKVFTFEQIQWMQDKFLHDYYWTFKNGEKINYMVRDIPKTEEQRKKMDIEVERIKRSMPKNLYWEKTDPKTWRK